MVAESRNPASAPRDDPGVGQNARTGEPFRTVSYVTIVEETAVYGPVRTVVWEDGGREAPSYPIEGLPVVNIRR